MVMKLPDLGPTNAFYDAWSNYLHPYPHVLLNMMATMGQTAMSWVYSIGNGAFDAYQKSWKLLDFTQIFTNANGSGKDATGFDLVQLIPILLTLGLVVAGIILAYQLFEWTLTSGQKGKDWPSGFVIIILCLGFAPLLVSGGTQVAQAMNDRVFQQNKQQLNPMLNMVQNNSVDLKKVAQKNFDVKEKDFNKYSPVSDGSSDAIINDPIFTATMSQESSKKNLGQGSNKNRVKVFEEKKGSEKEPEKLDKGSWMTGGAFSEDYARVKVNWLGVIAGLIVFTVSVFLAIIELLLRFYRLAAYSLMMLYFVWRDASGKRAMQIMQLMEGSITGMAVMPISVLLFFGFIQFGMNRIGAMGLTWWPYTLLSLALMIAGMKGLMSGFSLIDQWTGVPSGQGSALQAAGAGALAASAGVKLGSMAASGAASAAKSGKDVIDSAHDASSKMSDKLKDFLGSSGDDTPEPPNKHADTKQESEESKDAKNSPDKDAKNRGNSDDTESTDIFGPPASSGNDTKTSQSNSDATSGEDGEGDDSPTPEHDAGLGYEDSPSNEDIREQPLSPEDASLEDSMPPEAEVGMNESGGQNGPLEDVMPPDMPDENQEDAQINSPLEDTMPPLPGNGNQTMTEPDDASEVPMPTLEDSVPPTAGSDGSLMNDTGQGGMPVDKQSVTSPINTHSGESSNASQNADSSKSKQPDLTNPQIHQVSGTKTEPKTNENTSKRGNNELFPIPDVSGLFGTASDDPEINDDKL